MKRWQFATIVLAILFAPPFLVIGTMQALLWLLYRLFPSAPFLAWLGIERYAATVLGAHDGSSSSPLWRFRWPCLSWPSGLSHC